MASKQVKLPEEAWDSHVHVVDEENFPFHPDHPYRPQKASLTDLLQFTKSLHISHVCLVAMSVYKTDNRLLLSALQSLNGGGRGIACIEPSTITDTELQAMHSVGVRGVRLNLRSQRQTLSPSDFASVLHLYAQRLKPLDWVLQIYISLSQLPLFASVIPDLGITVVIDHLGEPSPDTPAVSQEGYAEFMQLLERKHVFTKLSGVYRFPNLPDLDRYVKDVLRVAPSQVVWASDWPHSGGVGANPGGDRKRVQEYRKVDDAAFLARCIDWCEGDEGLVRAIWRENPRRLWRFDE
ncbi:MAG: hypothetical protein M1820_008830 [Bogoriella megaspora]|nr:MAG: hypothetical protein M1820_008830 [Bogoriella megaspora]